MKILIVKTSAIGDVIHSLPVAAYIKQRNPHAEIHWVVERGASALIEAHPHIEKAIVIDTKLWRKKLVAKETRQAFLAVRKEIKATTYDMVIDLQGNCKSALFTLMARSKVKIGFARNSVPEFPNTFVTTVRFNVEKDLNIRERYLQLVKQFYKDEYPFIPEAVTLNVDSPEKVDALVQKSDRPLKMVCFGSNWKNKQLTEETLIEFLKGIDASYIFVWGAQKEQEIAERLAAHFEQAQAIGQLTLPQWQRLMTHMDEVITMDSAALHLAETAGVKTFSFFGPSSAKVYRPLDDSLHKSFQGACPYGITFEKRCPRLRTCKTGACLREQKGDLLRKYYQKK